VTTVIGIIVLIITCLASLGIHDTVTTFSNRAVAVTRGGFRINGTRITCLTGRCVLTTVTTDDKGTVAVASGTIHTAFVTLLLSWDGHAVTAFSAANIWAVGPYRWCTDPARLLGTIAVTPIAGHEIPVITGLIALTHTVRTLTTGIRAITTAVDTFLSAISGAVGATWIWDALCIRLSQILAALATRFNVDPCAIVATLQHTLRTTLVIFLVLPTTLCDKWCTRLTLTAALLTAWTSNR